ncbi:MAG: hypothetical protein FGM54_10365 [Chitinophagaceae bacterium]|nr:hypothetical protein [Chitinophagaceae bacterium]
MPTRKKRGKRISFSRVKFYDEKTLAKQFGVSRIKFHRKIKPIIIADFPEIIKQLKCLNPDIGIGPLGIIYLSNHAHTHILCTNLKINDYIC